MTERALRVLHCSAVYAPAWTWGGPPRSIANLCEGLASAGHEISVFTTNAGLESQLEFRGGQEVRRNGVRVRYFPAQRSSFGIMSRDLLRAVRASVAEFDLIHLSGVWQLISGAIVRAALEHRVPYVVSPRGMLAPYSFTQRAWKKWTWYWLRQRRELLRASGIHCTSELEQGEVRRLGFGSTTFVVPNGLAGDVWQRDAVLGAEWRRSIGAEPSQRVLLFAGRLHHKKGLDFLPELAAGLSGDLPSVFVLAGRDEDGTGRRLQERFQSFGPRARLVLSGEVSTRALVAAYSGADVFLYPSRNENFGNAAVEAAACGCPVMLSDAVGVASELAGLALVRVEAVGATAWSRAVEELISVSRDESRRAAMSANILARFGRVTAARAMIVRYENMLGARAGQRVA